MNSIVCWNCRGIGVAATVRALKDLVVQFTPFMVFLSETKAGSRKIECIRRSLAFDYCFVVEAAGLSGGLALFWNGCVDVNIQNSCNSFIHALININGKGSFYFSGVYCDTDVQKRLSDWDKISRLNYIHSRPWGCFGDFNAILSQSEKEGILPKENRQIDQFRDFVERNGLIDMPLKGCRFTWCNNRMEGQVREKLDRGLVNDHWQSMFPDAVITALPAIGSDHSP